MSTFLNPSDPAVRLARLPQLRRWITVPLLLVLVTLVLGFGVKLLLACLEQSSGSTSC
jgi:hypothetical protein